MDQKDVYTISELAALFDISARTIRYYEEIGILQSEERESLTKQRCYSNEERRRLKLILRGKKLGFRLNEIKEMIELYESNPDGEAEKKRIAELADKKMKEIEDQIEELKILRDEILNHKNRYLKGEGG